MLDGQPFRPPQYSQSAYEPYNRNQSSSYGGQPEAPSVYAFANPVNFGHSASERTVPALRSSYHHTADGLQYPLNPSGYPHYNASAPPASQVQPSYPSGYPQSYAQPTSLGYPQYNAAAPPDSQYQPSYPSGYPEYPQYNTSAPPASQLRPDDYFASDGRQYQYPLYPPGNSQPNASESPGSQVRPGYYLASDGRQYPMR